MDKLLQDLWEAFSQVIQQIENALDIEDYEELRAELDEIISDTPEARHLRERLSNAGVEGIGGI